MSNTERKKLVARSMVIHLAELGHGIQNDSGSTKAKLARLRNALYKPVGADPMLWDITAVSYETTPTYSGATWEEKAVHAAMCLYARHQQSKTELMHSEDKKFAEAVAYLAFKNGDESNAVRRRFNALATSSSIAELTRHASGLIDQLRGENITFDYISFAKDLYQYQVPGGPAVVRLAWARNYRVQKQSENTSVHTTEKGE